MKQGVNIEMGCVFDERFLTDLLVYLTSLDKARHNEAITAYDIYVRRHLQFT